METSNSVRRDALLYVTDIHFWEIVRNPLKLLNKRFLGNVNVYLRRRHEFHTDQAAAFSDALAATGVKTVLLGGDFTSTATDGEFAQAIAFAQGLAARGLRLIVMPGNHDVYTFEARRKKRFERHFAEFLTDGAFPCRVTLPGGTPLVLAPTVCPNMVSSRGRITRTEIEQCAALLAEAPAGPLLAAGHYPVLHETPAFATSWQRRLRNAGALRGALGAAPKPLLYMAGHVHRFSYVRDRSHAGLEHLTTAAFFLQRPGQAVRGAFSEIEVADGGFRVFRHLFDEDWRREELTAEDSV